MITDSTPPTAAAQPDIANSTTNGASNGTPRTKICVYCGASAGSSPVHIEAARALGRAMAAKNIDLGESFPFLSRSEPPTGFAGNSGCDLLGISTNTPSQYTEEAPSA